VVDGGVVEQPQDVRGFRRRHPRPQRAAICEDPRQRTHAAKPLGTAVFGKRANLGVEPGGGLHDHSERGDPLGDLADAGRVGGQHPPRVGLGHSGSDVRAVEHGHRLVVADDGPVDGQLERHRLAANRGEDRLAAHPGRLGDGLHGRRPVAALDEQPRRGADDGAAGSASLRRAQRGTVRLLDRLGHFR